MTAPTALRKPPRLCLRAVEFRASDDAGDGRTLEGYAATFGQPTEINSWEGVFQEEIARGAFRKTLRERSPVLQFDHGRDMRTGSLPIGAIEDLREDGQGLFVRAHLFENDVVEPIRQAIEAGAIDGMSFRFEVVRDEWRDSKGKLVKPDELSQLLWTGAGDRGPLKRTLREVKLHELGPVVFPAYASTSVGVRSMLADMDEADRLALISDLAAELRGSDLSGAAPAEGTPDTETPEAPSPVDTRRAVNPRELLARINSRRGTA